MVVSKVLPLHQDTSRPLRLPYLNCMDAINSQRRRRAWNLRTDQQSAHNRSSMYTPIKMLLKVSASPGQARHNGDGDEDEDEDRTTWTKQIRTPFPFSRGLDTSARNLQSSSQSTEETNSFRTNPCLHFAPNAKPGWNLFSRNKMHVSIMHISSRYMYAEMGSRASPGWMFSNSTTSLF